MRVMFIGGPLDNTIRDIGRIGDDRRPYVAPVEPDLRRLWHMSEMEAMRQMETVTYYPQELANAVGVRIAVYCTDTTVRAMVGNYGIDVRYRATAIECYGAEFFEEWHSVEIVLPTVGSAVLSGHINAMQTKIAIPFNSLRTPNFHNGDDVYIRLGRWVAFVADLVDLRRPASSSHHVFDLFEPKAIKMKAMTYRDHPDYANFIAAICARPADDLPRLAFADWLDEHAGSCESCGGRKVVGGHASTTGRVDRAINCPACHGTGTNGAAERAEFIRLQIEYEQLLATMPVPPCKENSRAYEINRRCNELLLRGRYSWLPREWGSIECGMSRGFISIISLTLAQFEQHAAAIAKVHPVEKWVLTDVIPNQSLRSVAEINNDGWFFTALRLGGDLIDAMTNTPPDQVKGMFAFFATREAAMQALERAAYVVARRRAGIESTQEV